MVLARRLKLALLALQGAAFAQDRKIPQFQGGAGGVESLTFADYVRLTQGLTMPAIIKGFFDTAEFADVCACSSSTLFFDELNLPFTAAAGNPSHEFRTALQERKTMNFDAINGGDFYRNFACDKARDDYIFYDINNGALMSASVQDFFRDKIDPPLQIKNKLDDKTAYDEWFNEIFIGGSTKEYPVPGKNASGSAPHRAPVLNYYHQVCGKKLWHIAPHNASFGELDKYQMILDEEGMNSFMNDPQVYSGFVEPGDLLLNPPWLWHYVQTARGFNFAFTYKQTNFGWWADVNKIDPTHVSVNMQYGAYDLRAQRLPMRDLKQIPLGGEGLYGTKGAFILDLSDFRVPMWILKRYQREVSVLIWISVVTYIALALMCCLGCCWFIRKPRRQQHVANVSMGEKFLGFSESASRQTASNSCDKPGEGRS